jgi:transposase InsO family protein
MSGIKGIVKESNAHVWPNINSFEPTSRPDRLRKQADILRISKDARRRLEWYLWHEEKGADVSLTCRHFGIARKTFYKWQKIFVTGRLNGLEDKSRAPRRVRQKEFTQEQYLRFLPLRRKYLRYGKEKLLRIYRETYPEDIKASSWKFQKMIERSGLYYSPRQNANLQRKKQRSRGKPRPKIHTLPKVAREGFLVCLDTVQRSANGQTRFIYTAVDYHSKIAFAHAYRTHTSKAAEDFLMRLYCLLEGRIANIQTDNGSEFLKHFDNRLTKLNIPHYFSRPRTPKDNGRNERFNRTMSDEFLQMGNMTDDLTLLNHRLTEWLVEYNFHRPHQALKYLTPIQFHYRQVKVLPMCPSSTPLCKKWYVRKLVELHIHTS